MKRLFAFLFVSVSCVGACGGDDDSGSSSGGSGGSSGSSGSGGTSGSSGSGGSAGADAGIDRAAIIAACKANAAAICAKMKECDGPRFALLHGDENSCVATSAFCELVGDVGTNLTPAAIDNCATLNAAATCDQYFQSSMFFGNGEQVAGCTIAAGTLKDGEQCGFADQCQSLTCIGLGGAQCGKCVPRGGVDAQCVTPDQCDVGLFCFNSKCAKFAAQGEACGAGMPQCKLPLGCVGGKCGTPSVAGTACAENFECDVTKLEVCHRFDKKCVVIGSTAKDTEPCGHLADGTVAGCSAGFRCDPAGIDFPTNDFESTCVPASKVGEVCATSTDFFGIRTCELDLLCTAGKCEAQDPNACG